MGSEVVNPNTTRKFLESYSECGLIDPKASSPFFTWCRHVGNRVVQRYRLDRVLWNVETQINFLEAKVIVLPRLHLYHHPILFMNTTGPLLLVIAAISGLRWYGFPEMTMVSFVKHL